ncbi:hypothetical protein MMC19_003495 [Ptychographa xylographoides]|nr:hypothetical protein [Ptychographa xylographoides]
MFIRGSSIVLSRSNYRLSRGEWLGTAFQDMLLSFLFSPLYFFVLTHAARTPQDSSQTAPTVQTASFASTASTVNPLSPRSPPHAATLNSRTPPSTRSDPETEGAEPEVEDSPADLFNDPNLMNGIVCQATTRFEVLHRPDCELSAIQIHAPTNRGPGLAIPPTRATSTFRFYGNHGHCEFYVTATYIVALSNTGVSTIWEPTEIEWIQIWVHVRLRADLLIQSCVAEPGASADELRRADGGRGGASGFYMDADRLSSRMLQSDRTPEGGTPPPAIKLEILLHDGIDLARMRALAIAQGLLQASDSD